MSFYAKLNGAIDRNDTLLCVGLDPNPHGYAEHFAGLDDDPEGVLTRWGVRLIETTHDLVCCYKPNAAFYEQFGAAGINALQATIAAVPDDIPVLLDAKRGDIGSTAAAYARAAFDTLGADGVTVNAYLGQDSLTPFLSHDGAMLFVLAYTSNPSAKEIQSFGPPDGPLFEHVIRQAQTWGSAAQVGFVVGATQTDALARFRALAPDRWVLAPGVGAQGGSLSDALAAGLDAAGRGLILPVSRSIIYADDPRQSALSLRDAIRAARKA